eukprot:NODE_14181_length_346_cov_5.622896_g13019_i0.p2 GENE.NODE_14181_length_346_cov_5.622896_g13019_i0~~NODE_14181_length_346_cov_5.622896_g13019_i0.p2  ORF type:complete len:100 (+),score=18.60 NODE_14181_length_346_cov_5.622896_g13019_i0:22-321(+)
MFYASSRRLMAEAAPTAKKTVERKARDESLFVDFKQFRPQDLKHRLGVYRWNNLGTSTFREIVYLALFTGGMGVFSWKVFCHFKYESVNLPPPSRIEKN